MKSKFFSDEETGIIKQFEEQGYVIIKVADRKALDDLREQIVMSLCRSLGLSPSQEDYGELLDHVDQRVSVDDLNDLRVNIISAMSDYPHWLEKYFRLAREHLYTLVGNELAMQKVYNLSIQLPNDESSLLPLHSDVWSGNSPYEVVLWVPYTDCYKTRSMYILPHKDNEKVYRHYCEYANMDAEEWFKSIADRCKFLDVPYGHAVIFSHSLIHGNRPNKEGKTRFSSNIRFKNLFSPYGDKALGETFLPITTRPVTRFGLNYRQPHV